jgi:hypothetical protein
MDNILTEWFSLERRGSSERRARAIAFHSFEEASGAESARRRAASAKFFVPREAREFFDYNSHVTRGLI